MFAARRIAQLGKIYNDGFYLYGSVGDDFWAAGVGRNEFLFEPKRGMSCNPDASNRRSIRLGESNGLPPLIIEKTSR